MDIYKYSSSRHCCYKRQFGHHPLEKICAVLCSTRFQCQEFGKKNSANENHMCKSLELVLGISQL